MNMYMYSRYLPIRAFHGVRDLDVRERELAAIHFINHAERLFGKTINRWVITSIDTDQWMIVLLAMSTERIVPNGERALQVTVQRIVSRGPRYIFVNKVFDAITNKMDGGEPAWPPAEQYPWVAHSM